MKPAALFQNAFRHQLQNYELWDPTDPLRLTTLRASGLPFCARSFIYNIGIGGLTRRMSAESLFYVRVGTVVHEWIQEIMGPSQYVLGDWYNKKTKKIRRFSIHPDPQNKDWQYRELSVSALGAVGHVDGVFVLDRKAAIRASAAKTYEKRLKRFRKIPLFVIDYKTCTTFAQTSLIVDSGVGYRLQLQFYCEALTRLGLKVEGFGNPFVPRDRPHTTRTGFTKWNEQESRKLRKALKRFRAMHRQALDAKTNQDFERLWNYGDCGGPYCVICRSPNPRQHFDAAVATGTRHRRWPASRLLRRK